MAWFCQVTITGASVDIDLCRHIASLSHSELKYIAQTHYDYTCTPEGQKWFWNDSDSVVHQRHSVGVIFVKRWPEVKYICITLPLKCYHYNGIIMGIKSPASRLFTQAFIQVQIKENIKLCITGLCVGNSPVTGEFLGQRASNAKNVSIWWRHHDMNMWHVSPCIGDAWY